ncbi:MAG: BCAM0308 family protein [Stellaceae bacterium]
MKQANTTGQQPRRTRRIAGHAQQDHILDPYQAQQKLHEGRVCGQCGAAYHDGRWQWMAHAEGAHEALCAACRRINDKFPAGVVTLRGDFAKEHKEEMVHLARHQEEAEKNEHPLNRIISIEEDVHGIVMTTTDIHLPRRIGEAVKRAFHGEIEAKFEEDGYFVRVDWTPAG